MKPLVAGLMASLILSGSALAQELPPPLFVTEYRLAVDNSPVYGLFDLGSKPSIRLVAPALNGGKLKLQLHGKHYQSPGAKPFSISASFEDVSGRVFDQSSKIAFVPAKQTSSPRWFKGLESVVGLYGSQVVEIAIPPGTSVINLLGDDDTLSDSPYQLIGYVSHITGP